MQELKRIRNERGWSQRRLAKEAGVDQVTVNHIETGKRSPNVETLEKLARALDIEVADLFPKAEPPLPFEFAAEETLADKVYRLGELMYVGWDWQLQDRLEADDEEWFARMRLAIEAYTDVLLAIAPTQVSDPEAANASLRYMRDFNAKLTEAIDPEHRHRFANILEESGEQLRELVANG